MTRFRMGQWVSTSTPIPGAHTTPEGRAVGIYVRAYADQYGNAVPEHVSFQRPEPVVLESPIHGGPVVHHNLGVYLPPEQLDDLQPLDDPAHIPAGRAPYTDHVPEMAGK